MLSLISTFNFFFIITSCQKPTYYGTYTKIKIIFYIKKKTQDAAKIIRVALI